MAIYVTKGTAVFLLFFFAALVIITFPSDSINVTVTEGNQTTLTCTARGVPAPEFMWYRESELINGSDTRLQISSSEIVNTTTGFIYVTSKLNITVIDRSDSGVFRCVATNVILGELLNDSQSYTMTVNCKLKRYRYFFCSGNTRIHVTPYTMELSVRIHSTF